MIITIILAVVVAILIISAQKHAQDEEITRSFTDSSYQILFAILLSIILSVSIALQADIPASSGHGGFVYIIIPSICGIGVLIGYFISLFALPKKKLLMGLIGILINICVGIIVMNTDY